MSTHIFDPCGRQKTVDGSGMRSSAHIQGAHVYCPWADRICPPLVNITWTVVLIEGTPDTLIALLLGGRARQRAHGGSHTHTHEVVIVQHAHLWRWTIKMNTHTLQSHGYVLMIRGLFYPHPPCLSLIWIVGSGLGRGTAFGIFVRKQCKIGRHAEINV
jgi:hypothetical protein